MVVAEKTGRQEVCVWKKSHGVHTKRKLERKEESSERCAG